MLLLIIGIDRQTGALLWEPRASASKAKIAADQIHKIGAVSTIEHGERGIERESGGVPAQQPIADRMKRTRPGQQLGLSATYRTTASARSEDLL